MSSLGLGAPTTEVESASREGRHVSTIPSRLPAPTSRQQTQATLHYDAADGKDQVCPVGDRLTVGRNVDNDIQLLDPEVSKSHFVIERLGRDFVLRDLGSANGTYINGMTVERTVLHDGDVVLVGHTSMRVEIAQDESLGDDALLPFDDVFTEARSIGDSERTMVTIVQGAGESSDATHMFVLPMENDFPPAALVADVKTLQRDYERLRVAFDLARAVGLETDLKALGETLLDRILDVLPADSAVIMLRGSTGRLSTLASYARSSNAEVRIPRAIVEQVLRTREALLTSDAQLDEALRSSHTVVGQQIRSALCVPLVVAEEAYGVMYLSTSAAAGAYEERDLALLRAIATPAALAIANARLVARAEEDARTRAQLSRFLSPALVERVVNRDIELGTAGDAATCTVLFSDIRGFTSMSLGVAPEALVFMLNEYFDAMVEVVFEHGGVLDKFMGDGMMAVWGTPVSTSQDAAAAVRAAHRMRDVLHNQVNVARARRGEGPLFVGCGIATGSVIAGAMGGKRRQDFTVIGDTVNLASRLCGQARGGQILLCEATEKASARFGLRFRALEARTVRGVAKPVPVFEYAPESRDGEE